MFDVLITVGWLTFNYFGWKYTPMNLGEERVCQEKMCLLCQYERTGEVPEGFIKGIVKLTHVHTYQTVVVPCFLQVSEDEQALTFRASMVDDQVEWIPDFDSFVADV